MNNRELLEKINKTDVISFDIYDTLIFRFVREPAIIFKIMYEMGKELFPPHTNVDDFYNARRTAEKIARDAKEKANGTREVNLAEIYNYMPPVYGLKNEIMALELDTEMNYSMLNIDIYETIKEILSQGKKVIFVSDMYLSSKQIKEIFSYIGADACLPLDIFVSNEYGVSKSDGKLFDVVTEKLKIDNSKFMHIGDNVCGDIGAANNKGISTYHYDVISDAMYKYPYLLYEKMMDREITNSLMPLRLLAASKCPYVDSDWFAMGAMVMGPFLTLAAEWVLDTAEDSNINTIRPLMREGKFISVMLKNAAKHRKAKFSIEPIYISRLSVYTASLEKADENMINNIISTCNMSVGDAFDVLKIDDYIQEFSSYNEIHLNELSTKVVDGRIAKDVLLDYLKSDEIIEIIRKRNKGNRALLYDYMRESGLNNKAITVDFGWRGSIQHELDKCLDKFGEKKECIHLLYISKPEAILNVIDGVDIRGFMGNWGKEEYEILSIFARFLELFFYCEEGTTIWYEREESGIKPITRKINYPEKHVKAMRELQEGVLAFQQLYLREKNKHKELSKNELLRKEAIIELTRMTSFPTKKEALVLGELLYDQNFGADTLTPIIEQDSIEKIRKEGFDRYYSRIKSTGANWNSGVNAIKDSGIYIKSLFLINRKYKYLSLMLMCKESIKHSGEKPIILVGAGENGKMMVTLYNLLCDKKPIYILDNNRNIQGANLGGMLIRPITEETVHKKGYYVFSMTYKDAYVAVKSQIKRMIGKYEYISYFEDSHDECINDN